MLNQNYTAKLLDLEDVNITKVKNLESGVHIWIELPRADHVCPCCGAHTDRVHDYREQIVKDIPLGRTSYLHLRKRRYRCMRCGKRFAEKNSFLPRYYRATSRLIATVIQAFRNVLSAKEIASRYNISIPTALRYFDCVSFSRTKLPEVLSIDEFKGNAGGYKYQSILTDPEHKVILDILPNRFEGDLISYFRTFENRNEVKYFISDMNPHFRAVAAACFPKAKRIADRYHVTRMCIWAMENVRKKEQSKLSKEFRIYFKQSRRLLMKDIEKLTDEEMDKLALMFEIAPRLADAYRVKNDFLKVMHSGSSKIGKPALIDWLTQITQLDLPEFESCAKAYHNWFQEILNALDYPWSNGYTEGCNNKTKVIKRTCYGVRNFRRFRKRILFCAGR